MTDDVQKWPVGEGRDEGGRNDAHGNRQATRSTLCWCSRAINLGVMFGAPAAGGRNGDKAAV